MNFQEMTKNDIKKYGESIGVQLDMKYKKDELIEQLKQHLMFCIECGQEIAKTDKFCFNCGTEVGKKTIPSAVTNVTTPPLVKEVSPIETPELAVAEYKKNKFRKLLDGDYGLAKTYWVFGVLVNVIVNILFSVIEVTASSFRQELAQSIILIAVGIPYGVVVLIGTWRASSKYQGPKFWAILAKLMVILGTIGVVLGLMAVAALFRDYTAL